MKNLIDLGLTRDSADILAQTDKAFRVMHRAGVTSHGTARPVWIPKSKVTWRECQGGMGETMHVPAWLARKL